MSQLQDLHLPGMRLRESVNDKKSPNHDADSYIRTSLYEYEEEAAVSYPDTVASFSMCAYLVIYFHENPAFSDASFHLNYQSAPHRAAAAHLSELMRCCYGLWLSVSCSSWLR